MDPLVTLTIVASFICGYAGYSLVRSLQVLSQNNENSKNVSLDLTACKQCYRKTKRKMTAGKSKLKRNISKSSGRVSKSRKKQCSTDSGEDFKSKKNSSRKIRLSRSSRTVAMCACPCVYFVCKCCGLVTDEEEKKGRKGSKQRKKHLMDRCRDCCCCCGCCSSDTTDESSCDIDVYEY
uniref:Uncharacterized protein n=1 Tax=Cacopsylla melanoneura TaxID=428564 RepID=A0A8D9EPX6_9HEMI